MLGMGREGEEKRFVGGEVVEDRGQKSRLCRRRPKMIQAEAGQSQETVEARRILGQKSQGVDGDHFSRVSREFCDFGRGSPQIEILHVNGFPFVNFYPLMAGKTGFSRCGDFAARNREYSMQKTILIVEDNELNMKLFNDLLEAHGYKTVQTRSGVEAVDLARLHKPDLILMDIQLPEVSGLQVTQWIKESEDLRHIPVIAITAFAMKGDEEKIRQGGCEAYLSKPISIVKFLETVRNYLHEQ
jgi:two-component system cell cycle response regulator DivK